MIFKEKYVVESRDIYDAQSAFEKEYNGLHGWGDCFGKASLKVMITGGGIGDASDAVNHTGAIQEAFDLGKGL